jgi:hypothetical protein
VGQRSTAASADDQDVTRLVRDAGKHGAGLAALNAGLDVQVGRELAPGSFERFSQPLAGIFGPYAAQVETGASSVGDVAARRDPGMNGH